jgi:hypothetical protein
MLGRILPAAARPADRNLLSDVRERSARRRANSMSVAEGNLNLEGSPGPGQPSGLTVNQRGIQADRLS